ncbi:MAG: NAD(P)H-dependent oxidoreductase [Cyanobacteria bacterium]|nr:NAD(P)H-dependent oxidoreductase [Cyanobacteria bacterium CG_2015-16_32_12]NCO78723.1 NAD(P)H-dependent oxidoreductase [Cyanobacteria bacterium CG_2015-22_32_23]NCQ03216.1 NAD(P)H-dependent oxidoreductase [Cyanobacteria bacterium CG_2015-09_32_10]NCQ40565.1 NAD(P)H-dependent oxidoreductase [Cyanobacteria bacterium CG_2015-04_32_10]NCS85363.1 NAD(P)H-dependent oxidoreductase [Cyanobacteria bacterium CG_2015-02_32_10]
MKISILVASNNHNLKLAQQLHQIVSDMGQNSQIIDLVEEDLPLYTPKFQAEYGIPEKIKLLAKTIIDTEGMIFVAPEYNGSIPPTLNNAIAWLSVSGDDWRGCFNGKPAIIATYSGGGGQYVLLAMRNQLSYIGMNVIGRQIITNGNKPLNIDSAKEIVKQLIKFS